VRNSIDLLGYNYRVSHIFNCDWFVIFISFRSSANIVSKNNNLRTIVGNNNITTPTIIIGGLGRARGEKIVQHDLICFAIRLKMGVLVFYERKMCST
jgi:hypothetical protein